ncbi:hypothetical protein FTO68_02825 [Methanocalculus taiwanensis]|uniref:Uncharacterized protein n=1 Tax=Methanocalculus taiwanensis TaxID=106207 RepID=A0ABD4TJ16_9EURY|nr:hypothetical protein [Methanocalculus taiwanensis]MCQ1537923.1 hypothetical protein [Methanocalculus taiwanensis]
MDKKDGIIFLIGLVFIIVVAVVIKPMATGESPDLSLPDIPSIPGIGSEPGTYQIQPPTPVPLGQIRIPHPSTVEGAGIGAAPSQVWDGSPIQLGIGDPATYGLRLEDDRLQARTPIDEGPTTPRLATYATFSAGTGDGLTSGTPLTTEVFAIPFPRWEIWYTLETSTNPGEKIAGSDERLIGMAAYPRFTITVMDASDPSRVVATISPTEGGIIDNRLWEDEKFDPRPWSKKILEGGRSYYLIVERRLIDSYEIEIKVPVE